MKYSEYHPDWKDVIRPAILRRDGYKCLNCGIPHKSRVYLSSQKTYVIVDDFIEQWALSNGHKVFTIHLNVCHLNHDKSDNRSVNLSSFCPKCHKNYDRNYLKIAKTLKLSEASKSSKDFLPTSVQDNRLLISEVRQLVKSLTGVKIEGHETQALISVVLKY